MSSRFSEDNSGRHPRKNRNTLIIYGLKVTCYYFEIYDTQNSLKISSVWIIFMIAKLGRLLYQ